MFLVKDIKISNSQRMRKKESALREDRYYTPPKSEYRQSTFWKVDRLSKKFGYQYDWSYQYQQPRIIQQMKEDFNNKCVNYFNKSQWARANKMGRKQKYQKNIQLKRPLKMNPLIKIFSKIEWKMQLTSKILVFDILKYQCC